MEKNLFKKIAVCLAGSFVYAAGITVVKVCNLGISPITSAPYAFSFVVGQSLGTCTMYLNVILYVIQKLVLKKEYTLRKFLTQFILSSVFAVLIDFTGVLFGGFVPQSYVFRMLYLIFGCFVLAAGVCGVVMSDFGMLPGEGVAVCIQKITKLDFGICKIIFDSSMVVLALIISLAFLGRVEGVREGTLVSAFMIGWFARYIGRFLGPRLSVFLNPGSPNSVSQQPASANTASQNEKKEEPEKRTRELDKEAGLVE